MGHKKAEKGTAHVQGGRLYTQGRRGVAPPQAHKSVTGVVSRFPVQHALAVLHNSSAHLQAHQKGGNECQCSGSSPHTGQGKDGFWRRTALIQSSFSLSLSAMKNMLSSRVIISKEKGLLMESSAPLMDRQRLISMIPRGGVFCKGRRQQSGERGFF